jgi:hypothetical protein
MADTKKRMSTLSIFGIVMLSIVLLLAYLWYWMSTWDL